jgi:hypothetical protein
MDTNGLQYQALKARALAAQQEREAELKRELEANAERERQKARDEAEVGSNSELLPWQTSGFLPQVVVQVQVGAGTYITAPEKARSG